MRNRCYFSFMIYYKIKYFEDLYYMSKIENLIFDEKWKELLNYLKNNKFDLTKIFTNRISIFHHLCIMNKTKILKYVISNNHEIIRFLNFPPTNDSEDFASMNENAYLEGDTCLHIFAKLGHYKLLTYCVNKFPNYVNITNINGETIFHYISNNDILKICMNIKNANINSISKFGFTPLLINISKTTKINDKYHQNVILLLNKINDIEYPKNNTPFCFSCKLNKTYIVKLLLEKFPQINVNAHSTSLNTPIIYAYDNNNLEIINLLLKNKAEINNYYNHESESLISKSIQDNNLQLTTLLINNNADINQYNEKLETASHCLFTKKNVPLELIFSFVLNADLSMQNIKGETPLHILLKNYDWKHVDVALKNKLIDFSIKNSDGKNVLQYINKEDMDLFFNLVIESKIINTKLNESICKLCDCLKNKDKKCIHDFYLQSNNEDEFYLVSGKPALKTKFWSTINYEIIYTIELLKIYNNISIPTKKYTSKEYNDFIKKYKLNILKTKLQNQIDLLLLMYGQTLCEMTPYAIIWADKHNYYIDNDLEVSLKQCLENDKIRYVFNMISIIIVYDGNYDLHANLLLFDKKTGILERFNPTKNMETSYYKELDDFILDVFGNIYKKFLKKNNLIYINNHYMNSYKYIGYQYLSMEHDRNTKQQGEIDGYCLAWCYWYLETRINNPNINPIDIINLFTKTIIKRYFNDKDNDLKDIFVNYIRDYANKLVHGKNLFMLKAGVKETHLYDVKMSKNDFEKISKKLKEELTIIKN